MKDILKMVTLGLVLTTFGMFFGCQQGAEVPRGRGRKLEQRKMPKDQGQEQEQQEQEKEESTENLEVPQE